MEWLDGLIGTAATAASGGVFGLVGSLTGGIFKYFKAKQEHSFQKDSWAHEVRLQEMQMQARAEETEQELAIEAQKGSWGALQESMKMQAPAGQSYRWVCAIKDLFRPILTTGLFVLTWLVWDSTQDPELREYIVYSVVFTASTAGMWWFADRAMAPPGMKNR